MRAGWQWARADLRRRWVSLALVALLAGLAGGAALAAVAGAAPTTTSWDRLREAEGPDDVSLFTQEPLSDEDLDDLRAIPGATTAVGRIVLLSPSGMGLSRRSDAGVIIAHDEESLREALRAVHLDGRLPDPNATDEVVVNEFVAEQLGLEPGDDLDLVGGGESLFSCYMTAECEHELLPPIPTRVVGIVRHSADLNTDAFNSSLVFAPRAFEESVPDGYLQFVTFAEVQLDESRTDAETFSAAVEARFPGVFGIEVADPEGASVHDALAVEARALLLFAAVAAVAGLVASAQALARHNASSADELRTLAMLGMTRRSRFTAVCMPAAFAIGASLVLALVVAIAASPLLPVGLGRRAEPDPGLHVDSVVLGVGLGVMLVVLTLVFVALAWFAARDRSVARDEGSRARAPLGRLPLGAVLGIGMARGATRRGGVVVGAVSAVIAAVVVSVAAGVLIASNDELQRDPQAYGQPWDAYASVAPEAADTLASDLRTRDELAAVAVADAGQIGLSSDGEERLVPAVGFEAISGEMDLVVFDGRGPAGDDEVLLGSELFDDLDATIGGEIDTAGGEALTVVGRGIIPIVGSDRPSGGALLTRDGFRSHATGEVAGEIEESGVAFTPRDGEDLDALLDGGLGPVVQAIGSEARIPSEVANLTGIGRLPLVVAAFTSLLAAIALAHALLVSERRHRRDVATWRALGMRRRASATTIGWAGLAVVAVSVVIAVPLGVVVGRVIWRAIASSASIAANPVVPAGLLIAVVLAAVVGAALAASWPARRLLRLRPAAVLHGE